MIPIIAGIALISIIFMINCIGFKVSTKRSSDCKEPSLLEQYTSAVSKAKNPSERPKPKLLTISECNEHLEWKEINNERYVKVTTWKKCATAYEVDSLTTGNWNLWVAIPSELKNFGKNYVSKSSEFNSEALTLRIKQVLGLPFQNQYNHFIEFWVKPEDLFRPSHNPDVTKKICEPVFEENGCPNHKRWIEELMNSIYHCEVEGRSLGYPWTQLGYTYDWSRESSDNIGLTEFCVKHGSTIYIEKVHSTESYFKQFSPFELV